MSQSNSTNYPSNQHSFPNFQKQDYEIDLRELFVALWKGKFIITIATMLFGAASVLYAYQQPNIYQSNAKFVVQTSGGIPSSKIISSYFQLQSILTGQDVYQMIRKNANNSTVVFSGLSISVSKNGEIFISNSSLSPEKSLDPVQVYAEEVNDALKTTLLSRIEVTLAATQGIIEQQTGSIRDALAEKYAELLFQKAILESPETQLISVITPPVKPTTHIKPKRAKIVIMGTMLGAMFGIAIVLIRFAFRREELETE
ncbi:Wzz/FepE/Etk N-terminal domain-containing protein [Vibrio sp. LaRot3]|uniref:Wzz/FepE/Etk N-terminal domain-containing protein n=1 Tax=Vibrio sp. LaRot3 TaxID=2998829 RepID=UPI0022CE2E36|nr:Wzz/FepE/Etk N-terminal domain-containing protein [Vibrio sp. LaRot3]MDA0149412.1 Wzz/FepE/Etk N-terminal domain-containing protein [Vibrio sp. LaRot3]